MIIAETGYGLKQRKNQSVWDIEPGMSENKRVDVEEHLLQYRILCSED